MPGPNASFSAISLNVSAHSTTLVIANHRSMVQHADRIVVLDRHGAVIAAGGTADIGSSRMEAVHSRVRKAIRGTGAAEALPSTAAPF